MLHKTLQIIEKVEELGTILYALRWEEIWKIHNAADHPIYSELKRENTLNQSILYLLCKGGNTVRAKNVYSFN